MRNWPKLIARLGGHLRSLTSGRFWSRAAQVFVRRAPAAVAATDPAGADLQALTSSPRGEKPLTFPFEAYRAVMDSGVAAKAAWAHRVKVTQADGSTGEILLLKRVKSDR
jgi:hypothetical protein